MPTLLSPEAADLVSVFQGAKRGLVIVGEMLSAQDTVRVMRVCRQLGWPIVADVLSGLRIGGTPPGLSGANHSSSSSKSSSSSSSCSSSSSSRGGGGGGGEAVWRDGSSGRVATGPVVLHHMDHLLLGDKAWWAELRPDVVLQIGPHLTSKRLGQFLVSAVLLGCFYGFKGSAIISVLGDMAL